jgi:hypothetical protein
MTIYDFIMARLLKSPRRLLLETHVCCRKPQPLGPADYTFSWDNYAFQSELEALPWVPRLITI